MVPKIVFSGLFSSTIASDGTDHFAPLNKIPKSYGIKFSSVPSTPEKQITSLKGCSKTNSFIKNFSQISVHTQSPLNKESYEILYPDIPSLDSKKSVTPQKIRDRLDKGAPPPKRSLFTLSKRELFQRIITNPIIMQTILKELSNGDLYRLSQVSRSLEFAVKQNVDASGRFNSYMKTFHSTKENYRITPPSSPEKDEEEIGSVSPSTRKHQDYWEASNCFYIKDKLFSQNCLLLNLFIF